MLTLFEEAGVKIFRPMSLRRLRQTCTKGHGGDEREGWIAVAECSEDMDNLADRPALTAIAGCDRAVEKA